MREVTESEIKSKMRTDNPWWQDAAQAKARFPQHRAYFAPFYGLFKKSKAERAIVVMGPRQVGKTVILRQTIEKLIQDEIPHRSVFYASIDQPIYTGLRLEKLLQLFCDETGQSVTDPLYVIFDEIQYLKDWEIHLKALVDSYPHIRFAASGSAAAALRMKSRESGAGRFTDFPLPPLTFSEFCQFKDKEPVALIESFGLETGIQHFNTLFHEYINYGGFPEIVFSPEPERQFPQLIGQDIVERVLLRDLPSIFGISDPQELNRLFVTLAYNTGEEVNLETLSQKSAVSKPTIKRYLEYLEAAFLIHRLYRIDRSAKRFMKETTFKVYLTNTSLRTALFGPALPEDKTYGRLVETAFLGQLIPSPIVNAIYYARWRGGQGEVDFVYLLPGEQEPRWAAEVKWSDRVANRLDEFKGLASFIRNNKKLITDDYAVRILSKSVFLKTKIADAKTIIIPASWWCYWESKRNVTDLLGTGMHPSKISALLFPQKPEA